MASLPRRNPAVCVGKIRGGPRYQLLGGDDAGTGLNGRPFNGISMGAGLCTGTRQAMPSALETNQQLTAVDETI